MTPVARAAGQPARPASSSSFHAGILKSKEEESKQRRSELLSYYNTKLPTGHTMNIKAVIHAVQHQAHKTTIVRKATEFLSEQRKNMTLLQAVVEIVNDSQNGTPILSSNITSISANNTCVKDFLDDPSRKLLIYSTQPIRCKSKLPLILQQRQSQQLQRPSQRCGKSFAIKFRMIEAIE